ncbi:hypothetical protein PHPALM_31098 [Phytophthora palmivora]|uniref:Helitron helicase-like domain-containing protein n=1 Tax=Phytophthora palmivora TaxID=4796 RepID=A0A2P4X3H6_9STRA|nr:hypothetical protein PHPALM_31098 [Phytophthora palmivora]
MFRYFDHLVHVIFDTVLNWDLDHNCARKELGLIGKTKAFFSATESQSSTGSLHAHMLIWIQNMPSTVGEYYIMCSVDRFRAATIKYVDAIATSNVPLDTSISQSSLRDFKASTGKLPTMWNNLWGNIASPKPLAQAPRPLSGETVATARALVVYQHHHWFHTKSCFKASKRTPKGEVCRMFMPHQTCTATKLTVDNHIEMKRDPGNEYINTYAPTINAIFKFNHEIKFLGAGEGPEKAYYTIKYTTKHQQDIENPWALHLHAFDKASHVKLAIQSP